jgi:hypothetical protein
MEDFGKRREERHPRALPRVQSINADDLCRASSVDLLFFPRHERIDDAAKLAAKRPPTQIAYQAPW